MFIECEDTYGPIEEMNVCDNLGDHLVGNVYIKVSASVVVWLPIATSRVSLSSVPLPPASVSMFTTFQFKYEEDAEKAVTELNNRWFNGLPIHSELSPVTDFREACCRQYEMG